MMILYESVLPVERGPVVVLTRYNSDDSDGDSDGVIYIHVYVIAYLYSKEWMFFDVAKINVKGERQTVIE